MRVLIASDKFKGSLTALEACAAIQEGVQIGRPKETIHCETLPVADGGDGIASTLTHAKKGTWKTLTVLDALGNPVEAGYGLIENGDTAIIEMAEASGLA
ncbi:MAG: glycerate kinase, partial [Verrucomicrobiota bacterium]